MLRRLMIAGSANPSPASRYWRVLLLSTADASWYSNQEIEFRASPGGADLTSPALAVARAFSNAYYDVASPDKAFDGGMTDVVYNAWVVSKTLLPPTFIGWDFGGPAVVREMAWLPQARSDLVARSPSSFKIQRSDDKVTWVDVATFSGISGWVPGTWKVFSW